MLSMSSTRNGVGTSIMASSSGPNDEGQPGGRGIAVCALVLRPIDTLKLRTRVPRVGIDPSIGSRPNFLSGQQELVTKPRQIVSSSALFGRQEEVQSPAARRWRYEA